MHIFAVFSKIDPTWEQSAFSLPAFGMSSRQAQKTPLDSWTCSPQWQLRKRCLGRCLIGVTRNASSEGFRERRFVHKWLSKVWSRWWMGYKFRLAGAPFTWTLSLVSSRLWKGEKRGIESSIHQPGKECSSRQRCKDMDEILPKKRKRSNSCKEPCLCNEWKSISTNCGKLYR